MTDPGLNYVSLYESVQLLSVFGAGAIIITGLTIRYLRKKQIRQYDHDAEERRFKLLEMERRPKITPPPSRDD